MTTVCISTAEGPIYLKFSSIQEAMKQIGTANLSTLHRWVESLDTQSFEAAALAHVEKIEAEKEFEVEGSIGKISVRPGQRFWMDDVWWEIVAKVGHGMYSPVGLGGCAVVTCKLISGEPDKRFSALKDGQIDWCGDSLATAVISYQRRVQLNMMRKPGPTTELVSRVVGSQKEEL